MKQRTKDKVINGDSIFFTDEEDPRTFSLSNQFAEHMEFELVKDKTSLLDDINEGDKITVHFDIRGNEYKDKYYVNLNAWRLTAGESAGGGSDGAAAAESAPPPASEEEMGDLPF